MMVMRKKSRAVNDEGGGKKTKKKRKKNPAFEESKVSIPRPRPIRFASASNVFGSEVQQRQL